MMIWGDQTLQADLIDYDDSTYNGIFTMTISGDYMVNMEIAGVHIAGSPRQLLIRESK